jgi:hypothetical protein
VRETCHRCILTETFLNQVQFQEVRVDTGTGPMCDKDWGRPVGLNLDRMCIIG